MHKHQSLISATVSTKSELNVIKKTHNTITISIEQYVQAWRVTEWSRATQASNCYCGVFDCFTEKYLKLEYFLALSHGHCLFV